MPTNDLQHLGSAKVDKRLKLTLTISAEELFDQFPELTAELSFDSKHMIRLAVNKKLEPQLDRYRKEINDYFTAIENHLKGSGFGSEEKQEMAEAELLKGEDVEEDEIEPQQDEQETFDKDSNIKEGTLILGDTTMESKLVPIKVEEKIELFFEHDSTPSSKEITRTGKIEIINESEKDRLWDIDLKFSDISQTNLEEDFIKLQELNPQTTEEFEYTFEADIEPDLAIKEFISTAGDPDVESYSLAINAENEIYMRIELTNKSANDMAKIATYKIIPEEFTNVQILGQSIGKAEVKEKDGKQVLFWIIEDLEQSAEATLDLRVQAYISDKDVKLHSGRFAVKYLIPRAVSNLEIRSFDAYTNNSFNIITTEMDEEPNKYECKFVFENKSEYQIRLVNADVYKHDDSSVKFVDIDPNEIPIISAGGTWESNTWIYESEEDVYPEFKTKVEFFTVANHQVSTKVKLNFADVELAVAALEGSVGYDLEKLPSFKVTPFNLSSKVTNTGGADLNEVKLVEHIQAEFLPPKPEEVEILVNGSAIDVPVGAISIEPEDQDPTVEHTITVLLEDLKDSDYGPMKPGDEVEFKYPITAFKPTRETLYQANATLSANTYPAGKPIEIKAEPIEIEVVHIRKNLAKGKDIKALETEGEFEITLSIKNMGEGELTNYRLKEKIPIGLELWDISHDAKETEKDDSKILTWKFEIINPGETLEVTYKIKPSTVDAKISDTQKDD
ncbi:MAG: COG1470 family protein [Candidatus Heimdallarchaeota archaeon]